MLYNPIFWVYEWHTHSGKIQYQAYRSSGEAIKAALGDLRTGTNRPTYIWHNGSKAFSLEMLLDIQQQQDNPWESGI